MLRTVYHRTAKRIFRASRASALALAVALCMISSPAISGEEGFLYNLSNFTGPLPLEWVSVHIDERRGEVYVSDPADRSILIFNAQGMEVFRFGDDDRLGLICDLAVLENGEILVLSHLGFGTEARAALVRCNYRGEFKDQILVQELPSLPGNFRPSRMVLRGARLYLVDMAQMLVVVTDPEGSLLAIHDLAERLGISRQDAADSGLGGFHADTEGNLLFTVPVQFKAYRLGPDGTLESFGQPGSSPGKFGVIAGIATDSQGRIFVVDTLRCAVITFGRDFSFISELGFRGNAPGGLIAPKELAIAGDGKLYVTQRGKQGVSVFRVGTG